MKKFKLLDLFSGIGGFSLGLERSGYFETVAFCEIEEFPRKVLAKHWPKVPCYHDVRELTAARLAADGIAVDAICGGFPCQDISGAGYAHGVRAGVSGPRSGLYSNIIRLADELGVKLIILENVKALLSDGLVPVLQDIRALGLDAQWDCVPASYVGSIQNRDRVWIVAHPPKIRMQGLFEGQDFGSIRQGWACRQEDLQQVYASPFGGNSWPQPLIRRGDGRPADWVDRIGAIGNAVVPQIPELIGRAIGEAFHSSQERAA